MSERNKTAERLALLVSMAAFVTLLLTRVVSLVTFSSLRAEAAQAVETHAAACAFWHTLKEQANSSASYLRRHPNGAPALGITAAQIQRGIDQQRAVVRALSGLSCFK